MSTWKNIRAWINRDDGRLYQVGNENLNAFEIIGYFLLIIALMVSLLHDKAGLESTWIGWVALFAGLGLAFYGTFKKEIKKSENT